MDTKLSRIQLGIFGLFLAILVVTFPLWAMKEPKGVLKQALVGNTDLIYFATDAPDNFIIYSPSLMRNVLIRPASQRMADMVISQDGSRVWASTKSGFVDMYEIPIGRSILESNTVHQRVAPVLSAIALTANERFIAVGYGSSENYNSKNIKIFPSDKFGPRDEMADFAVSGDIQDIVANPVKDIFYIINSHSDRVRIYNADRFRLEPDVIEMGNSPGNFVVRPDGLRAFGAINSRNAVAVANLETNEMIEYVGLNFPPYAMCFNKEGTHLYVASRDSASVVLMDTETDAILKRFDLPARIAGLLESNFPEMIGVSSDENYLYVLPKRSELVIYDISVVHQPDYAGQPIEMVQSTILPTTPFYMQVVRGVGEGEIPQADLAGNGG